MRIRTSGVALGLSALLLASCAHRPGGMEVAQRDPWEKFNRGVYSFNKGVDTALIKPGAKVYTTVTPKAAQRGARNFFNNVDEPFSFINSLLQGKPGDAMHTLGRFLVNTILGVGGLADHATDMGLEERPEDLGQTLAVWGVSSGPFVMLPFFGPSTIRDAAGTGAEFLGADPYRQFKDHIGLTRTQRWGLTGLELADTRSFLMETADPLLKTSLDEYATMRSAYLQLRQNLIYDGAPPEETDEAPLTPAAAQSAAEAGIPAPAAQPVPDALATTKPADTAPASPPLPADPTKPAEKTPKPTDQKDQQQ